VRGTNIQRIIVGFEQEKEPRTQTGYVEGGVKGLTEKQNWLHHRRKTGSNPGGRGGSKKEKEGEICVRRQHVNFGQGTGIRGEGSH